jgi:predicted nucleic acid-binding protein
LSKPTVYVETSVIGYLTSRQHSDAIVAGHQLATSKWWQTAGDQFELVVSQIVVDECAAGDPDAATERLRAIDELSLVGVTASVQELIASLLDNGAVPKTEPEDAAHIALAAVHGIEFLVTWNFRHIANPAMRRKIEEVIRNAGLQSFARLRNSGRSKYVD